MIKLNTPPHFTWQEARIALALLEAVIDALIDVPQLVSVPATWEIDTPATLAGASFGPYLELIPDPDPSLP